MRKSRLIILLAAMICLGNACKKNASSLDNVNGDLNVAAQVASDFETATGLDVVDQQPFNPDSRLQFATVQEAATYFNTLKNGGAIPIVDPTAFPSLPAPDDQGGCPDCKVVTLICSMPFHASVLTGRLYFKKNANDPQYNFVTDTWQLSGIHFGLNTSRPILVSMTGAKTFTCNKWVEYYIGIRINGTDFTVSVWYRIQANGDCEKSFGIGWVIPSF